MGGITCLILAISFASLRALADTGDTSPPPAAVESPAVTPEAPPPAPAAESPAVKPEAVPPAPAAESPAVAPEVPAPVVPPAEVPAKETAGKENVRRMKPIIVTGSRIPTVEAVGATPVDTFTQEDVQKLGAQTIREVLRQIPSAIGPGNFGESRGNGGDGSAAIGLRGILGGTLVLINGRRVAGDELGTATLLPGAVDINLIPLGAIERIEIEKDGASALYGADAEAGVVNIILKQGYTGTEVFGSYGNTTSTDVGEQNYWFVSGMANEKGSVMIGGNYYHSNALFSRDRSRSKPNIADPNNTSPTSNPGRDRTSASITNDCPACATDFRTNLFNGVGLVYSGAPGTTPSTTFDAAEFHQFSDATDRFPFPLFTPAVRPGERYSIFGNGDYDILGDQLRFFTEGLYTHTFSFNQLAPTPAPFINFGIVVPSNNFYNPYGVDITNARYRFIELGPRTDAVTADFFRFLGGLKGKIADTTWDWEVAALFSQDGRVEELGGDVNPAALQAQLNLDTPDAFNPFGNRANTAPQLAPVSQTLFERSTGKLSSLDGVLRGEVFDLPAGPLNAAVGLGRFEERADFSPDAATKGGQTVGFTQANPFTGQRDVQAVYAEIQIPVTSPDWGAPGFHAFSVNAAFRYDDYSDFGNTVNPKVSFRWQPFDKHWLLRGSYSTSFKAPRLDQLNFESEGFPEVLNPLKRGAPDQFDQIDVVVAPNPNLKAEEANNYALGTVYQPPFIKGLTVGVDYYRLDVHNFIGSSTEFILQQNFRSGTQRLGINPNDRSAVSNNAAAIVAAGDFSNLLTGFNQDSLLYDDSSPVVSPYFNLNAITQEGLDFTGSYLIPTDQCGSFTWNLNATYVFRFQQKLGANSPWVDKLGDFSGEGAGGVVGFESVPRLRGNLSLFWDYKKFELGGIANYTHNYRDFAGAEPPGHNRDVQKYVTFDLQTSYQLPYDAKVTVGCLNVLDTPPPRVDGAFADKYDRDLHDLRQRFVYFSIDKKF